MMLTINFGHDQAWCATYEIPSIHSGHGKVAPNGLR